MDIPVDIQRPSHGNRSARSRRPEDMGDEEVAQAAERCHGALRHLLFEVRQRGLPLPLGVTTGAFPVQNRVQGAEGTATGERVCTASPLSLG